MLHRRFVKLASSAVALSAGLLASETAALPLLGRAGDRELNTAITVQADPSAEARQRGPGETTDPSLPFSELNAALAAARAKLEELSNAAEIAVAATELRRELDALKAENAQLARDLDVARAAEAAAREEARDVAVASAAKDRRLEALLESEREARTEADRLRRALADSGEARSTLEGRLGDLEETLDEVRTQAAAARRERGVLEKELDAAGSALARAQRERDQARTEAVRAQTSVADLEDEVQSVEAEAERLATEKAGLERELAVLRRAAGSAAEAARDNLLAMEDKIRLLNQALTAIEPAADGAGVSTRSLGAAREPDAGNDAEGSPAALGGPEETATSPTSSAALSSALAAALPPRVESTRRDGANDGRSPETAPPSLAARGPAPSTPVPPDDIPSFTAELPLEKRLQARGLLTEVDASVDGQGLRIVVPGASLFTLNSERIERSAYDALARVAELIALFEDRDLVIIGHTDALGDSQYNQGLSERRAGLIADFFADSFGIPRAQIEVAGRGESQPIASNATLTGRRANRRVEILIKN